MDRICSLVKSTIFISKHQHQTIRLFVTFCHPHNDLFKLSQKKSLKKDLGLNICSIHAALTSTTQRNMSSLSQMHRTGPHFKDRPPRQPLDGKPFAKGVILKVLIKKPRKPNSANRKCVLVRLSTGKEMCAYVPGIGHNLQEHNVVLVRCGRLQDVPGVKLKCVRGVYDLPHVIKK